MLFVVLCILEVKASTAAADVDLAADRNYSLFFKMKNRFGSKKNKLYLFRMGA